VRLIHPWKLSIFEASIEVSESWIEKSGCMMSGCVDDRRIDDRCIQVSHRDLEHWHTL
jgi:hypothetical protein